MTNLIIDQELWLVREMDSCIANIFLHEAQDVFGQLFHNFLHEPVHGMNIMVDAVCPLGYLAGAGCSSLP